MALAKKGQQLFSLMGGDTWRGHMGVFGKEKAPWVLELDYCDVLWSLARGQQ